MCIKNQGVQCLSIMYLLHAGLARHSFDANDGDVHGPRLKLVLDVGDLGGEGGWGQVGGSHVGYPRILLVEADLRSQNNTG